MTLDFPSTHWIEESKAKIWDNEDIKSDKQLEEGKMLQGYSIQDESTCIAI